MPVSCPKSLSNEEDLIKTGSINKDYTNSNVNDCITQQIDKYFIKITDRVQILEDRSLKIDNITMDDIGEYSCEADNAVGTIVASGMLLVHCEFP